MKKILKSKKIDNSGTTLKKNKFFKKNTTKLKIFQLFVFTNIDLIFYNLKKN